MIKPRQRESGGYYWVSVKILETQSFCNQPHITQASPSDIKIIYSAWFKKKKKAALSSEDKKSWNESACCHHPAAFNWQVSPEISRSGYLLVFSML